MQRHIGRWLVVAWAVGASWVAGYDHMRLKAIDAYLGAVVGTRTEAGGSVAPLNRADALAVLAYEALAQAAAARGR